MDVPAGESEHIRNKNRFEKRTLELLICFFSYTANYQQPSDNSPPPQTGLMFLSTGVDIHLLCHISLQGFPPNPSFRDYWEFTEPVTCSVGAIIAMKERYGQLKGESYD